MSKTINVTIVSCISYQHQRDRVIINDEIEYDGFGLQPATLLNMVSMASEGEPFTLNVNEQWVQNFEEWEAEQNEVTKRINPSAIETITIGEPKDDESSPSS